ncbi:MAG: amidase domain-containing protein [Polyangiaceae bacterium]
MDNTHRFLSVLGLAASFATASCVASTADTDGDNEGSLGEAELALSTYSFFPAKTGDYAGSYWNNPNTVGANSFYDFTNEGGDCTNFANQAILAGLANSIDKLTVYNARLNWQDKQDSTNDWWYSSPNSRATPEWAGANGLFTYLKKQAAHPANQYPSWAGLMVTYVSSGASVPAAATLQKGDVISLSTGGIAYHSVVVAQVGASASTTYIAYRSAACDNNSCPANKVSMATYGAGHPGITWNVFRINGFRK